MIAATGVINLCMVVYHNRMSSRLGPAYAQLAVLVGVVNVAALLTNGLSVYFAKVFSRDAALKGPGAVKTRLARLAAPLGWMMLGAALLLALVGPWVSAYLRLPSLRVYAWAAALALSSFPLVFLRSALQGLHSFWSLGMSMIAQGLGAAGFAVWLVWGGLGVEGALLGSLLGALAGILACLPGLWNLGPSLAPPPPPAHRREARHRWMELGQDTAALGLFSLLCFLDIFIFKHFHVEAEAALYVRAALVAKAFLYLPSAFNLVALPAVAAARAKGKDFRPLLLKFLATMTAMELAGLAVLWNLTGLCIAVICGNRPEFLALAPLVRWFSLAVIPLALYQLVLMCQLAAGVPGTLALETGMVVAYAVLLELFHAAPFQLVGCLGAVGTLGLLAGLALSLRPPRKGGGLSEEESLGLGMQERIG